MTATATAVAAAAASGALAWRPPGRETVRRRLSGLRDVAPAARPVGFARPSAAAVRLGIALAVCAVVSAVLAGHLPVLLLAIAGVQVGWAVVTLRARTVAARSRQHTQQQITELCDALAAELATGAPAVSVLEHAGVDWPILRPIAAAARLGGDVVGAFAVAARSPGAEALHSVGAAWQVSARSGAALAGVLGRLSDTLRADEEARREVDACLAAPRATARILAVLPVVGLALGTGVGSDPVAVLSGSVLGAGCVAAGSALAVAGVFWVERIAARART